ncbi:hypothetical protein Lal_00003963 [Lupinus albus]|uniref:Hexosyltransferase n=1 Tax=Lupinus albus TaxID=3870 RepID=A0A6A5P917_LUPAL|nr:putative glucuronosyltransferase [Lupinus albus]KAF1894047.1 hypothetical protein Lal_00003963 [Lupinus albus]
MGSEFSPSQSRLFSTYKLFLIFIFIVSIGIFLLVISVKHEKSSPFVTSKVQVPSLFEVITKVITNTENMKIGLVNIDASLDGHIYEQLGLFQPQVDIVSIHFDHVNGSLKWNDFFPELIYEDGNPNCHEIPMPKLKDYDDDVNVIVAKVPCGNKEEKRDVFRLQVNLVVANLAVKSGWVRDFEFNTRKVYVVFVGSCGPMIEIFRCDDLLMQQGEYLVYLPDLKSLKHQILMPIGSCHIAPAYAQPGKELWRPPSEKVAYVTILHSSEAYVCGAIALAQSILKFNHLHHDLLLLVDHSITPKSIRGLKAAGWKIKKIEPILNPFAKNGSYNEWNYSKLRIWQLTMYDKIIFLDADVLIIKNIEMLFFYPQLSASLDDDHKRFNSGFMIIEPSQCMFEKLMQKMNKVHSYNGSEQGFLNEVFTLWHRLSWKVNYLKHFERQRMKEKNEIAKDVYAIHYLGLKPWMCYRDYDCNWDMQNHHAYSSDLVHQRWWKVYDKMPLKLKSYCGLTKKNGSTNYTMERKCKKC